jgi:glycosyltransferase involved in cell wall biosynthesis
MSVDISILISTRNRLTSLKQQFEAFEKMDVDGLTYEIIVVDNGSTDGTYEWLKGMASRLPVKALLEPRPGKNIALNRALPHLNGDLVLFTDDDAIPVPSWLKEYQAALERWPDQEIFGGPVEPLFPPDTPEALRPQNFRYAGDAFVVHLPDQEEGLVDWLPMGPNFAVRWRTLRSYKFCEDIGPTDNPKYTMGSEMELLRRLTARGEKSVHLPRAQVSHIIRSEQLTLRWLKGRGFRIGRYRIRIEERDTTAPRLFGVPRYLWRIFAIKSMRSAVHQLLNTTQKWEYVFAQKILQGQIYEYRRTKLDRVATDSGTVNGEVTVAPGGTHGLSM